ncbi:nuclear autoantigen Sp-100 isoform X3 [Cricetulus griseus]|uniref:Nuclear autoantigen Sp-100 isoform X3 n=1 Tax=Cricetulus griseus TaxID=10029 RepID=A0A9J7F7R8_CRIGR|nr:nuclear autoantigen Sp-100 isoform X3 [Cricetulus griseus]
MSTEQEDTENNPFKPIFLHFKRLKVSISTAIKKPFPFLEFLRDNELITNKMYDDLQDSCTNLVPLQKVVYRALEELEKRLDMVVLGLLFSDENMKAYPDLELILKSFGNVSQNTFCSQRSDRGDLNSQLSLEQGPGNSCSQGSLPWSPSGPSSSDGWRINDRRNTNHIQENQTEDHQSSSLQIHNVRSLCENGLSEDLLETVQINPLRRDTTGDNTDELERDQATPDAEPEDIKQENSSFVSGREETEASTSHNQASEVIVLSSEDSHDGNNHSGESTPVICQSSPRNPRQHNVDFSSPELPVTCGTAKGILHKKKFEQGIHIKSIRSETGGWLTPMKFEIKGDRGGSKNWRQSIRCCGEPLKKLIEEGKLPNPPRKRGKKQNPPNPRRRTKKKPDISKQCKVCGQGRRLHECAMCKKFYHKRCHIPPEEVKSGLWSCIFCKTKDQLSYQENQARHKESEVLRRKMLPEEQQKCELLLLTIYCHPKSRFFISKPKKRKENFPDIQEHMWLNKIKYRLNRKTYLSVQHFVKDMRLIFWNHRIIYNNCKFSNLGVTVRSLFEKTFKRIFSIEETSN